MGTTTSPSLHCLSFSAHKHSLAKSNAKSEIPLHCKPGQNLALSHRTQGFPALPTTHIRFSFQLTPNSRIFEKPLGFVVSFQQISYCDCTLLAPAFQSGLVYPSEPQHLALRVRYRLVLYPTSHLQSKELLWNTIHHHNGKSLGFSFRTQSLIVNNLAGEPGLVFPKRVSSLRFRTTLVSMNMFGW